MTHSSPPVGPLLPARQPGHHKNHKRDLLLGGWKGPIQPMPTVRDWERVVDTVNPLCPQRSLWFTRGWLHASRTEIGRTTGTTKDTKGTKGSVGPCDAGGGWGGEPQMTQRTPSRFPPADSTRDGLGRIPSASSVSSAVSQSLKSLQFNRIVLNCIELNRGGDPFSDVWTYYQSDNLRLTVFDPLAGWRLPRLQDRTPRHHPHSSGEEVHHDPQALSSPG